MNTPRVLLSQLAMVYLLSSLSLVSVANAETELPALPLPMPVRSASALVELQNEYRKHCASEACETTILGRFLLLDLSGAPEWRLLNRYEQTDFVERYADVGASSVYVQPNLEPPKNMWGWYRVYGVLFPEAYLPQVVTGPITSVITPEFNKEFEFGGQIYALKLESRCYPIVTVRQSTKQVTGYDADWSVTLSKGAVSQSLGISTKHRTDFATYASCEEAIANLAHGVAFELVGDLDSDGQLDLVFFDNAGGEFPTVLLSSKAKPDQLVEAIGMDVGC